MTVETAVVYRAARLPALPPAAASILKAGGLDGVLHYSRRSALAYVACATDGGLLEQALAPTHYCLSRAVAEPLAAAGARDVRIAARPEEAALLDLIAAS